MTTLYLTNGDAAAELLRATTLDGPVLPWRDALHEGPIVAGASLEGLSALRVAYLRRRFGLPDEALAVGFVDRDEVMHDHGAFDRIEIWLEHDLYDQLQLLQILDFFASVGRTEGVVLVQADDFLTRQRPETIGRFAARARPLTAADLDLAQGVFADLGRSTPEHIVARLGTLGDALPFLDAALRRFVEELPAPESGLGLTEARILESVGRGEATPRSLFRHVALGETAPFLGDWSFYRLLDDLAFCAVPLVEGLPHIYPTLETERDDYLLADLFLSELGEAVLAGEEDHVAMSGLDRWWGGTRLDGHKVWRFDRETGALGAPS
ncbi:hypothetical protein [Prosthecomicrobium pneumaticum]|uniref:DUF1835 domain-containing protein n=1 Tax=Prosthecomicrobium pneumaticum TaxID=81895 RepID=A0A7W9CSP3_9HYPH|nr:hypothetical protein [Prosthecomicrobium pneumaticum]MBB5751200.1 hypothetical protein [Prosthecomicrobium pneumaticum]